MWNLTAFSRACCLVLALGVSGCGGDGPGFGPDYGPVEPVPAGPKYVGPPCRSSAMCPAPKVCIEVGVMSPSGWCASACDSDGDCTLSGLGTGVCGIDTNGDGKADHCSGRCTSSGGCPDGWRCTDNRICRPIN